MRKTVVIYVINYIAVNRQKGRFAGLSLYVSKSNVSTTADIKQSTLCYKDGPKLPLLNLTIECTEIGRYVIYYNERLDGSTRTNMKSTMSLQSFAKS